MNPLAAPVQIQVIPSTVAAPWVLTVPGQASRSGNGDATLPAMPYGAYTIAWGAVEGWTAPTPNVVRGTHESRSPLILTAFYTQPDVTTGTVVIDPNPDTLDIPWSLTGPSGFERAGSGDASIADLAAGSYVLTWGEVAGHLTPQPNSAVLAEGETVTFSQTYYLRDLPRGDLVVEVQPAGLDASWRIAGNLDVNLTGSGNRTFVDVPIGQYIISWSPVEGMASPSPNPATYYVTTDGTTTAVGVYSELSVEMGTVNVDVNPDGISAPWTLSGPDRFSAQGNGDQQLSGRAVGEYSIVWTDVPGYDTPAGRSGTLQADGTLTLTGDYVQQTGAMTINPEPDSISAPWQLTGPQGTFSGNGDRIFDALAVGTYTIEWRSVSGWDLPLPTTRIVSIGANQNVTVTGVYAEVPASLGTVAVDPRPAGIGASWSLSGPDGFVRGGSSAATFADAPAGSYTVSWNPMADWRTPVPAQVTQTLAAGETVTFIGVYGQLSGPSIQPISGTLTNGSGLTITGSGFGTHTMEVSNGVGVNGWIEQNSTGTEMNNLVGATGWDRGLASAPVVISTERAYSGTKSALGRVDFARDSNWQANLRYQHSRTFDRIYATFWIYWDPINLSPYRSTQWKLWRINHNGAVNDQAGQVYFSSRHTAAGNLYDHQWTAHCALDCSEASYDHCYEQAMPIPYYAPLYGNPYQYAMLNRAGTQPWTDGHPQKRQWNRVEMYIDRGTLDTFTGTMSYSLLRPGQGKVFEEYLTQLKLWRSETTCRNPQDPWQYFQMQNYWDDDGSSGSTLFNQERADFFFDDIFLQFGTQARVEMGDQQVYENCTRLEIQPPTSWSDGSISVNVNRGGFASGSAVYLFVVREDGTVSTGVPVTVQ